MRPELLLQVVGVSPGTGLAELNRPRRSEQTQVLPPVSPPADIGPVVTELSRVGRRVMSPVGTVREADDLFRPDLVAQMKNELAFGSLGGELDVDRVIDAVIWEL